MPITKMKCTVTKSRSFFAFVMAAATLFNVFIFYPTIRGYSQDGKFGEWSQWSRCLQYCGESYKGRYRQCVQPGKGYGRSCGSFGPYIETTKCNDGPCDVDGGVSPWGSWEAKCDRDCKDGEIKRRRTCNKPKPTYYNTFCDEPLIEVKKCPSTKECPVDAKLGKWVFSSPCTKTCGNGKMKIKRTCTPVKHGGKSCISLGRTEDVQDCNIRQCPIDGKLGEWGAFTPCTKTCGSGKMTRKRTCAPPKFGGKGCKSIGNTEDVQTCNAQDCSMPPAAPKPPATPKLVTAPKAAATPKSTN